VARKRIVSGFLEGEIVPQPEWGENEAVAALVKFMV
jgi:hypothetical protein